MDKPLIMIVEDDYALLEGIRELLELTDYRVIPATNGVEALQLLDRYRPDLIVSDIMMPEMDGYEFHNKVPRARGTALGPVHLFNRTRRKDGHQARQIAWRR